MPEYVIEPTLRFLHKFLPKVPGSVRNTFYNYLGRLAHDPCVMPFPKNNILRLTGFVNLWRLRIGDYRLIYRKEGYRIICLDIGRRDEIYNSLQICPREKLIIRILSDAPMDNDPPSNTLQITTQPVETQLPVLITSDLLDQLEIGCEYHSSLTRTRTEEALLELEEEVPSDVIEKILDNIFPSQIDQDGQEKVNIKKEMEGLLRFKCPIDGCSKVFNNTRSGWDAHIESINTHQQWHPEVVDSSKRKLIFQEEFSWWFGLAYQQKNQKWRKLLWLLKEHVTAGKVTTYAKLSRRFYQHPYAAPAVVKMLKSAEMNDQSNSIWTNRVVKDNGICLVAGQGEKLKKEGVCFTDAGRVDFKRTIPVDFE